MEKQGFMTKTYPFLKQFLAKKIFSIATIWKCLQLISAAFVTLEIS
jgi:hypothetical protein